jgi:hypothetical protein
MWAKERLAELSSTCTPSIISLTHAQHVSRSMCLLKVRWWSFRFDTMQHNKLIVQNHCSAGHINSMPGDATMAPLARAKKQAKILF